MPSLRSFSMSPDSPPSSSSQSSFTTLILRSQNVFAFLWTILSKMISNLIELISTFVFCICDLNACCTSLAILAENGFQMWPSSSHCHVMSLFSDFIFFPEGSSESLLPRERTRLKIFQKLLIIMYYNYTWQSYKKANFNFENPSILDIFQLVKRKPETRAFYQGAHQLPGL